MGSQLFTDIVVGPVSQVVSEEQRNVLFNCTVKGKSTDWIINGEVNSVERNRRLMSFGVQFQRSDRINGQISGTIILPATKKFNGTRLICAALNDSTTLKSSTAVMTIAGILPSIKVLIIIIIILRSSTCS